MPVIGIAGQIGTGKSTVAREFQRRGAIVISGDKIGRQVVSEDQRVIKSLVKTFGISVLNPDGSLNRSKLRKLAFFDGKSLAKLNRIVHPPLLRRMRRTIAELRGRPDVKLIVVDAALILDWGLEKELDSTIVVESNRSIQLRRKGQLSLSGGTKMTSGDVVKVLSLQMPKKLQRQKADFVVINNGPYVDLRKKVSKIIDRLQRQHGNIFD